MCAFSVKAFAVLKDKLLLSCTDQTVYYKPFKHTPVNYVLTSPVGFEDLQQKQYMNKGFVPQCSTIPNNVIMSTVNSRITNTITLITILDI